MIVGDRIHHILSGLRHGDGSLGWRPFPLERYDAVTLSVGGGVMALGLRVWLPYVPEPVVVRMPADLDTRAIVEAIPRGERVRFPDAWLKTYTDVPEGVPGFEPREQHQLYATKVEHCPMVPFYVQSEGRGKRSLGWLADRLAEYGEVVWGRTTIHLWGLGLTPERVQAAREHIAVFYPAGEVAAPGFWTDETHDIREELR